MSKKLKLVFQIISTLVFLGLFVPFYFYIRNNEVRVQNSLIRKAKNDYFQREFLSAYKTYERLFDSTNFDDERARMNYGNAAFVAASAAAWVSSRHPWALGLPFLE